MAAHTKYSKELVDTVLQELAVGKSIREALKTVIYPGRYGDNG